MTQGHFRFQLIETHTYVFVSKLSYLCMSIKIYQFYLISPVGACHFVTVVFFRTNYK